MTARLAALLLFTVAAPALLAQPRGDAAPRHAEARAVLTDVLAQPAFTRATHESWQKRFEERIREWLREVATRLLAPVVGSRAIGQVLAWAVPIAAVFVMGVWLVRIALRRDGERPVGIEVGTAAPEPGHVLGAEAAALIRAGRVREGARMAYRAALRRLEEEGALAADPARTPREHLRLLLPSHRRAAALAAMTGAFEGIWYGARPAGADEGLQLLRLLGELECLPSELAK